MTDAPQGYEALTIPGFAQTVGPVFRHRDGSEMQQRFRFVPEERHMNGAGSVHGGMLMTLADICMGRSANLAAEGGRAVTVSLNCDFVGPGKLDEAIEVEVAVTRRTRSVLFMSATLAGGGRILMTASGVWKRLGA